MCGFCLPPPPPPPNEGLGVGLQGLQGFGNLQQESKPERPKKPSYKQIGGHSASSREEVFYNLRKGKSYSPASTQHQRISFGQRFFVLFIGGFPDSHTPAAQNTWIENCTAACGWSSMEERFWHLDLSLRGLWPFVWHLQRIFLFCLRLTLSRKASIVTRNGCIVQGRMKERSILANRPDFVGTVPIWRPKPDVPPDVPADDPKKADLFRFVPINTPKHDFKPAFCLFSLFFSRNSSFFCFFWPFLLYTSVAGTYPNKNLYLMGHSSGKKFILLSFSCERKMLCV